MWGTTAGDMKMMWTSSASSFRIHRIFWISGCNKFPCFFFFSWLPYNIAPNWEDLTSHETKSTLFRSRLTCLVGFWFFMWSVVFRDRFPCDSWPLDLLIWFCEEWNTSITKSQRSSAGIPSMRNTSIQRNNLSFCRTVWNWSLSLARVASEHSQESTWCWFWVFKVSCKIGVLKQSQPALFCGVPHMTILFVFTCVMSVPNHTWKIREAFPVPDCLQTWVHSTTRGVKQLTSSSSLKTGTPEVNPQDQSFSQSVGSMLLGPGGC